MTKDLYDALALAIDKALTPTPRPQPEPEPSDDEPEDEPELLCPFDGLRRLPLLCGGAVVEMVCSTCEPDVFQVIAASGLFGDSSLVGNGAGRSVEASHPLDRPISTTFDPPETIARSP